MARRVYSADEKAQALALYQEEGPTAAAKETGIPAQTIASWASRTGVAMIRTASNAAAVEARRVAWEERKLAMIDRMGEVAEKALDLAEICLESTATNKAKDAATTMAILVDKAQLLAGGATSRRHSIETRQAVIAAAEERALSLVPGAA